MHSCGKLLKMDWGNHLICLAPCTVRDKRAAEFPDSVLIALEKTDAYAMEVHPDTLADFYIDFLLESDKENTLKERLSEHAYERLNQAVLKKTGQPIDSLDNQDPSFVQLLLMEFDEPKETAKNDQVVDLYLYKQAWLMGKSIHGLEELKDHDNVTDKFFKMFEKGTYGTADEPNMEALQNQQFEQMIKLYQSGDIFAMEKWVNEQSVDEEFDEAMLDTRNAQMVERLEKLAIKQPTFFAVGAAHLSGKNGMLEMLKNRGYTVRKVAATFTGYAETFQPKGQEPAWRTHKNDIFGYELQTPSRFYDLQGLGMPDNVNFEVKFQMDMLDMNAFFVMNIGTPSGSKKELNLMDLEAILNDQAGEEERKLLSKKVIERQGVKGGQFKYEEEDNNYSIWQLFVREGVIHMFVVFREFDDFSSSNITKFYDSIRFFAPKKPKTTIEKYTSIPGGYSVEMPSGAKYRSVVKKAADTERPTVLHQYTVTDSETGVYYLMQYHLLPPGTTVENEQLILQNAFKSMAAKWKQSDKKGQQITYQGFPGMVGDFTIKGEQITLREILRGNRLYVLIVGSPKARKLTEFAEPFFTSFQLLPLQHTELVEKELPTVEAKMAFPAGAVVYENFEADEEEAYPKVNDWSFLAMDSLSGVNYGVNVYEFPKFYEVADKTTYYEQYGAGLAEIEGLNSITDTTFNGGPAWYLTYTSNLNRGYTHSLVFYEGFRIFEINVYAPTGRVDDQAWAFFHSFQPTKDYVADYWVSDRSETLLKEIQSRDSSIQLAAKEGIDRYELSPKNLSTIYQILEKDFPYDTLGAASIHELMLQELRYTNDGTTLPFLEKLYA